MAAFLTECSTGLRFAVVSQNDITAAARNATCIYHCSLFTLFCLFSVFPTHNDTSYKSLDNAYRQYTIYCSKMTALNQALKQSPLHHPGICYTEDIMNLVPQDVQAALSEAKTHDDERRILEGCSIQKKMFCAAHQRHCSRIQEILNFSGPCCNDHSTAGTCTGREGSSSKFLLIHLKRLREDEVPLIVLENVTTGEFYLLVCRP